MARIFFNQAQQARTGINTVELPASNIRNLKQALLDAFPTLDESMLQGAIAIDGEIIAEPLLEQLQQDSEIYFIPAIEGG
ncbi:MAG: hypothetical protein RQ757_10830 [Pseudomonadales bacterium]|nr:hypothetical protein [Pseudomonadales bacterium]